MIDIYLPMSEFYSQLLLPGFNPKLQLQLEYKANWLASELDEDIQESICNKFREDNPEYPEYEWYEPVYEGFKEDMKQVGFGVDQIYFSGFWSQGDGACFEGNITDIDKFFDHFVKPHLSDYLKCRMMYQPDIESTITDCFSCCTEHCGHYYHSNCMEVTIDAETVWEKDDGSEEKLFSLDDWRNMEEGITAALREYADNLFSSLRKDYEYLVSDEGIIEMLDANDHYFYSNGEEG